MPWRNPISSSSISQTQKGTARLQTATRPWAHPRQYRRMFFALPKKTRSRVLRYGLLIANVVLLLVVGSIVVINRNVGGAASPTRAAAVANPDGTTANPLDQLSSADIAVYIAQTGNLAELQSVTNKADTVNAQMSVSSADQNVVSKPQVVTAGLKSRKDIQTYTTVPGDSVTSIANKFGVTSDTIRWSNGLTGDAVAAGKVLYISPVNGIVYRVQAGDTVQSLASKYHSNQDLLAAINDTEIGGLPPVGQLIVIPDGSPPSSTNVSLAGASSAGGFAWGGYNPVYAGNGYDYGYCTWWAAYRRAQIGRPIPSNLGNASTWKVLAERAGLPVGNTPQAGAVIWFPPRDYFGHVGFVESVNPDGSANISEMNVAGWARVSYQTIPASQVGNYSYIY